MVLGAAYMLRLYRRIVFGVMTKSDLKDILDVNRREALVFAPLIGIVLWMGIYPSSFIDVMAASVGNVVDNYHAALSAPVAGE